MPTEKRIESTIISINEMLEDLQYEIEETIGPQAVGPGGDEGDGKEESMYYTVARARDSSFYIAFRTGVEFSTIVYPMNILNHLAKYLEAEEVATITGEDPDRDKMAAEREQELYQEAAIEIAENAEESRILLASFNLAAHSSTSLVDFLADRSDNGFPRQFQCTRAMFPYTGEISLQAVDDRVNPVIVAGRRGRRYVEHSFRIEKENRDPTEYEFTALI